MRGYVACTYVKHLTLTSAIEHELRDRRVEDRVNDSTQQALLGGGGLCPRESLHLKVRAKLKIQYLPYLSLAVG